MRSGSIRPFQPPTSKLTGPVFLREWFGGKIRLEPLPDGGLMAHWNQNSAARLTACEHWPEPAAPRARSSPAHRVPLAESLSASLAPGDLTRARLSAAAPPGEERLWVTRLPAARAVSGSFKNWVATAAVRQIFAFMRASTALPSTAARCTYLDTMPDFHPPIALSCCSLAPSRASIVAAVCRVQ
jgi:hypothetical protein